MPDVLEGFFSSDPDRVLAAVGALAGTSASPITSTGTLFRTEGQLQVDPDGIWSPDRFGVDSNERWAYIPVHGVVHRALLIALVSADPDLAEFIVPLVSGEAALADGALVLRPPEEGELAGWAAFEAIVGQTSPLFPLCRIRAVPVPPRVCARPARGGWRCGPTDRSVERDADGRKEVTRPPWASRLSTSRV